MTPSSSKVARNANGTPLGAVPLTPLDWLLVVIIAIPVLGTFFPFGTYLAGNLDNIGGGPVVISRDTTVILAFIFLTVLILFARAMPASLVGLKRNWLLFVFIFWALISSRWAEVPAVSVNRSGRLLIFALYAIYLIECVDPRKTIRILAYAILFSLLASLAVIAVYPPLSASSDGRGILGTWRGAMSHKNSLGTFSAIGVFFGFACWKLKALPPKLAIAIGGMAVLVLVLANSATALLATIIIVGVMYYFLFVLPMVTERVLALVVGIVFACAGGFLIVSFGSVFAIVGRDASFTGRAPLWDLVDFFIAQKPFWGYGHGIWGMPTFMATVPGILGFPAAHAHNFWLDLRLQLGVPGLVIGIALWSVMVVNVIRALFTRSTASYILPLGFLLLFSFRSYSETIVLDSAATDTFWVVLAYAGLAKIVARPAEKRQPLATSPSHLRRWRGARAQGPA